MCREWLRKFMRDGWTRRRSTCKNEESFIKTRGHTIPAAGHNHARKPTSQILHLSTLYVHTYMRTYIYIHIMVCTPRVSALESSPVWGTIVTLLNRETCSLVLAFHVYCCTCTHDYWDRPEWAPHLSNGVLRSTNVCMYLSSVCHSINYTPEF